MTGKPENIETVETILNTNKLYLNTIRRMSRSENINAFDSFAACYLLTLKASTFNYHELKQILFLDYQK